MFCMRHTPGPPKKRIPSGVSPSLAGAWCAGRMRDLLTWRSSSRQSRRAKRDFSPCLRTMGHLVSPYMTDDEMRRASPVSLTIPYGR